MARAFAAIAQPLRAAGLSAPEVLADDLGNGLLLVEDLGDRLFGAEIAAGTPQAVMWRAAVDALVHLRRVPVPAALPLPDGTSYRLPRRDRAAFEIEIELLLDWLWPELKGSPAPDAVRAEFQGAVAAGPRPAAGAAGGLVPARLSIRRISSGCRSASGVRQGRHSRFPGRPQRAFRASTWFRCCRMPAWTSPRTLETRAARLLLRQACGRRSRTSTKQSSHSPTTPSAPSATREILGIFARLARRDGKPQYLAHLPRIWRYLERNLRHAALASLAAWYDKHFPASARDRQLQGLAYGGANGDARCQPGSQRQWC